MALEASFLNAILRAVVTPYAEISFHGGDPGPTGANELVGRFPRFYIDLSYVQISGGRIVMMRETDEDDVFQAGTATHYGLWQAGSKWVVGGRLRMPVRAVRNTPIRIKRGAVLFQMEQR